MTYKIFKSGNRWGYTIQLGSYLWTRTGFYTRASATFSAQYDSCKMEEYDMGK